MKRHTAEREGISSLPAPILHHILSFLSQRKAVRTCVLSKSWRHLWSTRPSFRLRYYYFKEDKENLKKVLEKSLQVYYDQKHSIDDFNMWPSVADPELVQLLEKWIPILVHDMGVKIFHLYFSSKESACFDLPAVVFESESLQGLYLERCYLSKISCISFGNHLKTLSLHLVDIKEEETFAKLISSCPLIEKLSLLDCKGFKTIKLHNHHNLKSFELSNIDYGSNIEIYLPSTIGDMFISRCPNWLHHRNYFPGLTCLRLELVPLSNDWFNSLSRNFPCLEDLQLINCNGVDELKLSSRTIKKLEIEMVESMIKATIDTPSIKEFKYAAFLSQSISFSTTSSCAWNSRVHLYLLDLDDSQLFLKISGLVAAFSQSRISLVLQHDSDRGNNIEQCLSADISVCCSSYKMPVAIESLELYLKGCYYDSFFSDLVNGLFRIFRPREINHAWYVKFVAERADQQRNVNKAVEFLCRTLQMGRLEDDEGTKSFFWQQDLEEASLEVLDRGAGEWRPVQLGGTIMSWSEYVAALILPPPKRYFYYELRFRLKWRELAS